MYQYILNFPLHILSHENWVLMVYFLALFQHIQGLGALDGGIRNGKDIFKALALGAEGVIIARPFVNAVYGGQEEGVSVLLQKYREELSDTMLMCGAYSINEINRTMIQYGGVEK